MGTIRGRCGRGLRRAGEKRRRGIAGAMAALLLASASGLLAQAAAGGATGGLSGRLTDLYSKPVAGATLVLRNAATGAEAHGATTRNGAYHFSGLPAGEYILLASSADLGNGHIAGIYVAAGHESRVQAAVALVRGAPEPPVSAAYVEKPSGVPGATTFVRPRAAMEPATVAIAVDATLQLRALEAVPLEARRPAAIAVPMPMATVPDPAFPSPPLEEGVAAAELVFPGFPLEVRPQLASAGTVLAGVPMLAAVNMRAGSAGASLAVAGLSVAGTAAQVRQNAPHALEALEALDSQSSPPALSLSEEQLQALPLNGRHWEAFALEIPSDKGSSDEDGSDIATPPAARNSGPALVDGASMRLAFGRGGGRLRGGSLLSPGANEAAVAELRPSDGNAPAGDADGLRVETRRGVDRLHGQGFLFDRRNLWGAQNPFSQWVKETVPGGSSTTPVFTGSPYTAPEHEDRWGIGAGSRVTRHKLFWFAAYDGSVRNHPGVSSVRHAENFFAQPKNDEMQVLSARLGLSNANPVGEGVAAYSRMLESLAGLLGPATRTSTQWVGFGRLDWQAAERHHFTLEAAGARWNSPGGGLSRAAETFGNHSFGTSRASEIWLLGRWEAFLTPNLLAVTQGSTARHIFADAPNTPSPFEQTLNVNAWGQLPQVVVDSRYGFTIGNPARFGRGSYPDEHLYQVQEGLDWVRGGLLLKAGADWRHNADVTSMVRNHTGTYHYTTVENFASDALVFAKYGLSDALNRLDQHNCDARGRAWRDANRQLHGLGYLPCYSYYTQTMGPTDWHLATNDVAAFATAQWQPAKRLALSAALRWERDYFPPPIALVDNPELPLTQRVPSPGNQWGPRFSLAWGSGESRWPILHAGYGMYFGRTPNSVLETVLTQTGSFKGNLDFLMRPTDNLAGGGAPPFPYVLAGEPGSAVKPGAVELSSTFKNPEIHQAEVTLQEKLPGRIQVAASAVVSLARRLPVTMDTNFDSAKNPRTITYAVVDGVNAGPIKEHEITVPFYASWPDAVSSTGGGRMNPKYQRITELMSRANSTYEAATLRVSRYARRGWGFHARYTYGHAMDWNPNESTLIHGSSMLDPLDFRQEYGTSDLDVRHSASGMLIWQAPWKVKGFGGRFANGWMLSGAGQFHSGLPFSMHTSGSIPEVYDGTGAALGGLGPSMNGYGGDNRVYGVGRNTYRYPFTWKADVRMGKKFNLGQMRELELMAESFNLFNHQNVTRIETVGYTMSPGSSAGSLPTLNFLTGLKTGQTEFGKPMDVNATDFFRPRQFDFGMRMRF